MQMAGDGLCGRAVVNGLPPSCPAQTEPGPTVEPLEVPLGIAPLEVPLGTAPLDAPLGAAPLETPLASVPLETTPALAPVPEPVSAIQSLPLAPCPLEVPALPFPLLAPGVSLAPQPEREGLAARATAKGRPRRAMRMRANEACAGPGHNPLNDRDLSATKRDPRDSRGTLWRSRAMAVVTLWPVRAPSR
jgi:hypothetical protein